ncbi:ZAR1-like protein [Gigantopelta aegis]|uniref:ZAR1-like protein n=1 Tax=Gigantopelta aegis TaxID=1735272 RepID=UPI001B8881FF|nr:ZAR1-like protein [Gigantopelta aegis]
MAPRLCRCYGYFHCKNCDHGWESSQVYCVAGTFKVYYKQACKYCRPKQYIFPYRVEDLECPRCNMVTGECECCYDDDDDDRHIDTQKRHLAELCGKCRAGFPCGRNNDVESCNFCGLGMTHCHCRGGGNRRRRRRRY